MKVITGKKNNHNDHNALHNDHKEYFHRDHCAYLPGRQAGIVHIVVKKVVSVLIDLNPLVHYNY